MQKRIVIASVAKQSKMDRFVTLFLAMTAWNEVRK